MTQVVGRETLTEIYIFQEDGSMLYIFLSCWKKTVMLWEAAFALGST